MLTALALASLFCNRPAQAGDPTPKPFEALQSSNALSNVTPPPARKDGLKAFEDEITKSFQSFSPRGTLDGMLAPEYRPPPPRILIPNRKPKDELDWKSQLGTEKNDKNGFNGLDAFRQEWGDNKRDNSGRKNNSIEEYYKEIDRQKQSKQGAPRMGRPDQFDLDEDSKLPSAVRESAKTLKEKLLGNGSQDGLFKSDNSKSWFSDLFRSESPSTLSRDDMQAHEDYLARFKQILEPSAPAYSQPENLGGLTPLGASESSKPGNLNPTLNRVESFGPAAKRDTLASTPGTVGTIANPAAFSDFNAQALNSWNPLYSPPKLDLPKSTPTVSPPSTWDAPRRRF